AAHAIANSLNALRYSNRWDEAIALLAEARVMVSHLADPEERAALCRAAAPMLVLVGEYEEAQALLSQVLEGFEEQDRRSAPGALSIRAMLALMHVMLRGDYRSTASALGALAIVEFGTPSQRADI